MGTGGIPRTAPANRLGAEADGMSGRRKTPRVARRRVRPPKPPIRWDRVAVSIRGSHAR
jgi:hypothetical protein